MPTTSHQSPSTESHPSSQLPTRRAWVRGPDAAGGRRVPDGPYQDLHAGVAEGKAGLAAPPDHPVAHHRDPALVPQPPPAEDIPHRAAGGCQAAGEAASATRGPA